MNSRGMVRIVVVLTVMSSGPALAQQSVATAPTERVIALYTEADDGCRGGSGNDPSTYEACGRREVIGEVLRERGWCYGKDDEPGYLHDWHRCGPRSLGR